MSVEIIRNGNQVKAFNDSMNGGTLALAMQIIAQAKALAPVDTGALRNSLRYKTSTGQGSFEIDIQLKPGEAAVGSALEYAVYQEFGTRYMKPQPFLRPAIALYQGQKAADVMAKIIKEQTLGPLQMGETRINFFA